MHGSWSERLLECVGLMTKGQDTLSGLGLGMMRGFWRKQWRWADMVLGGAAGIWVYLNPLDLHLSVFKMGSDGGVYTTRQSETMCLAGLEQSPLGLWAGSHPPW